MWGCSSAAMQIFSLRHLRSKETTTGEVTGTHTGHTLRLHILITSDYDSASLCGDITLTTGEDQLA